MKKLIFLGLLALCSINAMADTTTESKPAIQAMCSVVKESAETIMTYRQEGLTQEEAKKDLFDAFKQVMDSTKNQFDTEEEQIAYSLQILLILAEISTLFQPAYQTTIENNQAQKDTVIKDFTETSYQECIKNLSKN